MLSSSSAGEEAAFAFPAAAAFAAAVELAFPFFPVEVLVLFEAAEEASATR